MLRKTNLLSGRAIGLKALRFLIAAIIALVIITPHGWGPFNSMPYAEAASNPNGQTNAVLTGGSARRTLESSLTQSVDAYKDFWQTVGTSFYNSNSDALDIVLAYDATIGKAAAKYGIDKAVIQSILFQEIRFINVWDEVDTCVQNTYSYLEQHENADGDTSWGNTTVLSTVLTGLYVSDSSTGLGQIYAKSAIKALNWHSGAALYDYNNWRDREKIWLTLKYDDAYNIDMIGLMCAYNTYILESDAHIGNPTVRDLFRIYNGSGPSAERYAEAASAYCLAFQRYNDAVCNIADQ